MMRAHLGNARLSHARQVLAEYSSVSVDADDA